MQYYLIDSKIPLYVGNGITSHNPPLHIHHHTELIYIIDGSVMLNVSGHEYALEKGDAAVIFPMQPHCFVGGERNWLLVNFVPGFCPDYRDLLMRSYPIDNAVRKLSGSEIERLLFEAYSEYKRGGEYSERITRGYISAAFGRLLSEIELSETKHQYYDMI
nr:cupin domain-containing protein [Clostridia bacterium]